MVVAESAAHAFRISVIGDNIRVPRELFIANRTDAVLVRQLSGSSACASRPVSELSISPWVMRTFDTPYAEPDELRPGHHTTLTAGDGSVNGTQVRYYGFYDDSFLDVC
jgi:hypothetical protein